MYGCALITTDKGGIQRPQLAEQKWRLSAIWMSILMLIEKIIDIFAQKLQDCCPS